MKKRRRGNRGSGDKKRSLAPFSSSSMSSSRSDSSEKSPRASNQFLEGHFEPFREEDDEENETNEKSKSYQHERKKSDLRQNKSGYEVSIDYNDEFNVQNTEINMIDNSTGNEEFYDMITDIHISRKSHNEEEEEEGRKISGDLVESGTASTGVLGKINMPVAITPSLENFHGRKSKDDDFYMINTNQFNSPPVAYANASKSSDTGSSDRRARRSGSSSVHGKNSLTLSKRGRSNLGMQRSDVQITDDENADDESPDENSHHSHKHGSSSSKNNVKFAQQPNSQFKLSPDYTSYSDSDSLSESDSDNDSDSDTLRNRDIAKKAIHSAKDLVVHPSFTFIYSVVIYVCVAIFVFVSAISIRSSGNSSLKDQLEKKYSDISVEHKRVLDLRLDNIEGVAKALSDEAPLSVYRSSDFKYGFLGFLSFFVGNFSDCSAVGLSLPNGHFFQLMNFKNGRYSRVYPVTGVELRQCEYSTDEAGSVYYDTVLCKDNYNVTEMEWYRSVNTSIQGDCAWTGPIMTSYIYYTFSSTSFYRNEFTYVISASLIVENVSTILDIDINDEDCLSFIVDIGSKTLVGSTDPNIKIGSRENSTNSQVSTLYDIEDIEDANVLDTNKIVIDRYGSWNNVVDEVFWAGKGGQKRLLSITRIDRKGLSWAVVTIASPEITIIETRTICLVIFVCFVCGMFITGVSLEIIRPVSILAGDMKSVATLEDMDLHCKTSKRHISIVKEIGSLQLSFLKLRTGIIALTKYVAAPVIRIVMKDCINIKPQMKKGDVTVLFVDLAESTTLIERIQNANLYSILSTWFREFGTLVDKNGGIIDKFIGDSIMALYGTPDRLKNKEKAACATAVEFHDAAKRANKVAKELAKKKGVEHVKLRYRVGIHTGPVYVGHIGYEGHINYTACGNTVNVANTMEQLGKMFGLTPLITGEVKRKIGNDFISVFLCVITLPGYDRTKERVYHLVGFRDNASQKSLDIVREFDRIHDYIGRDRIDDARELITKLKSDTKFKKYVISLDVILHRIDSGALTQEMYTSL